jgi:hypothetical protein
VTAANGIEQQLSIFIITYNRASCLRETLEALAVSPFARCRMVVLDNCSTDDTPAVAAAATRHIPGMEYRRNVTNIGLGANAVQPFLLSETAYTWVLCDDDVCAALLKNEAQLLIVGGHAEPVRSGAGRTAGASTLIDQGLNYFRDTSFLPSTIYSTAFARTFLAECYSLCALHYPHMAIILGAHRADVPCHVSHNRLVTPSIGTQSYSQTSQMRWWFALADTIQDRSVRRNFLASQFEGPLDRTGLYGLLNTLVRMKLYAKALALVPLFNVRIIGSIVRMIGARARGVRYP